MIVVERLVWNTKDLYKSFVVLKKKKIERYFKVHETGSTTTSMLNKWVSRSVEVNFRINKQRTALHFTFSKSKLVFFDSIMTHAIPLKWIRYRMAWWLHNLRKNEIFTIDLFRVFIFLHKSMYTNQYFTVSDFKRKLTFELKHSIQMLCVYVRLYKQNR